MAGTIKGAPRAARAIAATPIPVVGGIFVTTMAEAEKIVGPITRPEEVPDGVTLDCLGYLGEAGPKRTIDQSTNLIKAWGGDVLLTTREGAEAKVELPAAEYLNPSAQRLLYGSDNVTWDNTKKILTINGDLSIVPPHVAVVVLVDTDSARGTLVYPDAQASISGDLEMDGKAVVTLPLTLNLRPVAGKTYREYWKVKDGVEVGLS